MGVLFLGFCFLFGLLICGLWLTRRSPLDLETLLLPAALAFERAGSLLPVRGLDKVTKNVKPVVGWVET